MKRLLLLTALLTLSTVAFASSLYRWVDRDGVVNYSERPPEGVNAVPVDQRVTRPVTQTPSPDAPASDASATPAEAKLTDAQRRKLEELRALHAEEERQVAEIRKSNCEKSRKVLERLTQTQHIRVRNDDGSQRIIGEDERQKRINEAQVGIASNCD